MTLGQAIIWGQRTLTQRGIISASIDARLLLCHATGLKRDFSEDVTQFSREYSELTPVVEKIRDYLGLANELEELEGLVADPEAEPPLARWNSGSPI